MNRIAALGTILVFALTLSAQNPPPMPKPSPEHQRLHYYVGDWKVEGDAKASPFGPGGKFTSTDHDEMLGDFFLLIHSESTGPMGSQKSVAALGYDPKEKVYTTGLRPTASTARRPALSPVIRGTGPLAATRVASRLRDASP